MNALRAAEPTEPDWIALLTCVEDRRGERRNFWAVKRTGDYRSDNHIGVGIAREVLHAMHHGGTLGLLNQIIHDMIANGKFDGVEPAFWARSTLCFVAALQRSVKEILLRSRLAAKGCDCDNSMITDPRAYTAPFLPSRIGHSL